MPITAYQLPWSVLTCLAGYIELAFNTVNGIFINCFDLDSYFNATGLKEIKFGRREEIGYEDWSSGDELVVYTKFDFDHRTRWWTQLSKEELRTTIPRVLE